MPAVGICSLIAHILLTIAFLAMADQRPTIVIFIMLSFTFISVIALWYKAIQLGMKKSIKDGVKVSLYYIIPYIVMLLPSFLRIPSLARDKELGLKKLVAEVFTDNPFWTLFGTPFNFISNVIMMFRGRFAVELMILSILEPLIIISIILLINFLNYNKSKETV